MTDPNSSDRRQAGHQSIVIPLLRDFCGYTTFGGLGRVIGSSYVVFRVIWFLLFVGGFAVAIVQLVSLYRRYEMKPINTKISLQHKQPLSFPTVTVCNFNPLRKTKVAELPSDVLRNVFQDLLKKRLRNITGTNMNSTQDDDFDSEGFANPDDLDGDYKLNELLAIAMARTRPEDMIPLGHQFEDMIISCKWRGVNCKNNFEAGKYWGKFWHYRLGNCYVFNPYYNWNGHIRKQPRSAYRAGSSQGLILELNIEQAEYIDGLTKKAGAVIQITPHGKMPFPDEEGLSVAPGFSTSIALTKVLINRVDAFKNRSCVDQLTSEDKNNLYHLFYNATYSQTACLESCVAYNQLKDCTCMEYRFPRQNENLTVCDTLEKKTVTCLRNVNSLLKQQKLNCSDECPSPCTEETFKMITSFAVWPSLNYQSSLENELIEGHFNFSTPNGYRDNVMEVRIFYKELNYELMQESVSYEFVNFLADIGGQLGLWLGVSVLTGAEVLELILLIVINVFGRRQRQTNNSMVHELGNSSEDRPDTFAMDPVSRDK